MASTVPPFISKPDPSISTAPAVSLPVKVWAAIFDDSRVPRTSVEAVYPVPPVFTVVSGAA